MIDTDYTLDDEKISYEITDDGYDIYKSGRKWVAQHEPFIPKANLTYEENCIQQIEEILRDHDLMETVDQQINRIETEFSETEELIAELLFGEDED